MEEEKQERENEDDRMIDPFLDYDVPYNVNEALQNAGVDVDDDLLSCRHLPRLLELLQSEQNVVITERVADQIKQTIAYATQPLEHPVWITRQYETPSVQDQ